MFYFNLAEQEKEETEEVKQNEEQAEEVKHVEDEQILEEEAVQIVQPLQDFHTKKGQTARFTCEIAGTSKIKSKMLIETNTFKLNKHSLVNNIFY